MPKAFSDWLGKDTHVACAMATGFQRLSGDARRITLSSSANRFSENQRPMSSILCRNGPQCRKFTEGTQYWLHLRQLHKLTCSRHL